MILIKKDCHAPSVLVMTKESDEKKDFSLRPPTAGRLQMTKLVEHRLSKHRVVVNYSKNLQLSPNLKDTSAAGYWLNE